MLIVPAHLSTLSISNNQRINLVVIAAIVYTSWRLNNLNVRLLIALLSALMMFVVILFSFSF